ncbi:MULTISPECIES: diguanylate cyclase [unclassified Novosphingobium]|uniref:diguanylate cyclase domain-containing protein n=1 Tax=unclassified Novosphingobium TaxID=2644732 RepID=UPI0025EBD341|nr:MULTISPECIES: diguanylate cyclase [unclassified Novosphingobium]HQV04661.1 diguanylate cyclase [Novosphingobium sp.]
MADPAKRLPTLRDLLARAHLRLILFTILLATLSLVLSGGLVIRNYAQRNLELVARSVAYTVEPAVLFEDRDAIRDGVVSVAAGRGIERVEVLDPTGQMLAEWQNPASGPLASLSRAANRLFWPQPAIDQIHRGEQHIAEVRIYGNSEGLLRYILAGTIIALSCLGLTVLATRVLARRLQNEVVRPLEHVAEVAHAVREDRAFERRIPASGIAEIDRFGQDFNALLAELQGWHAGLTSENRELAWRASHDGLTGLGNRQLFESVVGDAIAQAQRGGHSFAVLFFDVDRFKSINDSHGHESGDAALIAVADRLRGAIRQHDLAFRMGGDEFAVLLAPLSDQGNVDLVLERIRTEMDKPYRLPSGIIARSKLSVGVALFPDHGETIEDLLRKADAEMYRDKRGDAGSGALANA